MGIEIRSQRKKLMGDGRHKVVTTVRSHDKGKKILDAHSGIPQETLSYVIVADIAQEGAFDDAVKSEPFDAVVHTASPFFLGHTDPVKELLDPAIKGTNGILKSIHAHAPSVKRVVVTSSFAAIVNPDNHPAVYNEESWNPVTAEQALLPSYTYRASKTFAERAAWDFVAANKPNFSLTVLNPPLVLGPVIHHLSSLDGINASNERVRDFVLGRHRDKLPPSGVYLWVDVRDLAEAHARSLEVPEAEGKRFLITAGYFSNKRIVDAVRASFAEFRDQLPPADAADDLPKDVYGFDNSRSTQILGLKYMSLEESVRDTVQSIKAIGGL
jgi:nucleoside-diphosphate-sugar epimerase